MTPRLALLLTAFAALLVRGAFLASGALSSPPFTKYLLMAQDLQTQGLGRGGVWTSSPGYTVILLPFISLFQDPVTAARLVQLANGVLTCVLCAWVACRLYGVAGGIIAGLLLAAYAPMTMTEGELLTEGWVLLIQAAMVALLTMVEIDGGHLSERKKLWLLLAAGFLAGVNISIRPNSLLIAAGVLLFASLDAFRGKWSSKWVVPPAVALAIVLPVAPFTWHNYQVSGEFIPVTASFGSIFYSSNNYAAPGLGYAPPSALPELEARFQEQYGTNRLYEHPIFTLLAERASGKTLSPNEVSAFWHQEGKRALRADPLHAEEIFETKSFCFFNSFEHYDTVQLLEHAFRFGWFPGAPFGLLAGCGLAGLLTMRKRNVELLLFLIFATYFVTAMSLYVTSRLRLPVVEPLAILAGSLPMGVAALLKEQRFLRIGAALFVGLVVVLRSFSSDAAIIKERDFLQPSFYHQMRGIALKNKGKLEEAAKELQRAMETYPGLPTDAAVHLLEIYRRQGDAGKAEELEARLNDPLGGLSVSEAELRHKLKAGTIDREDLNRWSVGVWVSGRTEEALPLLEAYVEHFPGDPQGPYNLAMALAALHPEAIDRRIELLEGALAGGMRLELNAAQCYRALAKAYREKGEEGKATKAEEGAKKMEKLIELAE